MIDLIDRQEAIKVLAREERKKLNDWERYGEERSLWEKKAYTNSIFEIYDLPSADAQPVRHGKWIDGKRMGYDGVFVWHRECSECGYERKDDNIDNDTLYCPNCGARMDGEQDG